MRQYTFLHTQIKIHQNRISSLHDCFLKISESTDTQHLVVVTYLMPGPKSTRGAYYRRWIDPEHFVTSRGQWAFSSQFDIPANLPESFRLIRQRLDPRGQYPRTELDAYGWEFRYATFIDHAATLFAHELHHYRRYQLDLHPREGEHGANKWALAHVRSLGYDVEGRRIPVRQKKAGRLKTLLKRMPSIDPYAAFRHLRAGDKVYIRIDSRNRYHGQEVKVVRPLRSNAKRLVVETADGKQWRWPVEWLDVR